MSESLKRFESERGDGKEIKALAEKIITLNGVKNVKLTTIKPGQEI